MAPSCLVKTGGGAGAGQAAGAHVLLQAAGTQNTDCLHHIHHVDGLSTGALSCMATGGTTFTHSCTGRGDTALAAQTDKHCHPLVLAQHLL